jgi:hypothetical protein
MIFFSSWCGTVSHTRRCQLLLAMNGYALLAAGFFLYFDFKGIFY